MNFDPKKRFNESEHSKAWHDAVASQVFHAAAEAALASMQINLPKVSDMATAAANDWRMQGARRFLTELMSLTEPASKPDDKPAMPKLNYGAMK